MSTDSEVKGTYVGVVPPPGSKEPGVYIFRQMETEHEYIGSTVNGYGRFIQHTSALTRGDHVNKHLQRAFNESPFFEIEFVPVPPDRRSEEPLAVVREMEQKLINNRLDEGKPLLNIALDVVACGGGISPSEETRAKISAAMKGRTVSEETRRRTSQALIGRPHSEERKAAIAAAMPSKQVVVDGVVYDSIGHAARDLGLNSKQALRVRLRSPHFPNYHFLEDQLGNNPSL